MKNTLLWLGLASLSLLGAGMAPAADYPAWWTNRGVISATATTNDYIVANHGQLKWFLAKAKDELNANLPGGAGSNLTAYVNGLANTQNFVVVNQGQLKYAASLVYDQLIVAGYTTSYPWSSSTNDDRNYNAVNQGQMKNLFAFDLQADTDGDGLANWVETGTGIYVSPYNTGTDPNDSDSDDDGIADGPEVAARTDPTNDDTIAPTISIITPQNSFCEVRIP